MKYYPKLPRQTFEERAAQKPRYCLSMRKAIRSIERNYQPGYTKEPYIQLVEESAEGYRVVAEYCPGKGWLGPMQAAGLANVPGEFK